MPLDLAAAYERYASALYRYARERDCTHEEAQDLVGDVFTEALTRRPLYEDRGFAASAWLYRIMHSRLIDGFRRARRRRVDSLDALLAAGGALPATPAPDEAVADRLWCHEVLQGADLTAMQRMVLYLRFVEDRDLSEVAEALGRSVGAIKGLQHRAIANLAVPA